MLWGEIRFCNRKWSSVVFGTQSRGFQTPPFLEQAGRSFSVVTERIGVPPPPPPLLSHCPAAIGWLGRQCQGAGLPAEAFCGADVGGAWVLCPGPWSMDGSHDPPPRSSAPREQPRCRAMLTTMAWGAGHSRSPASAGARSIGWVNEPVTTSRAGLCHLVASLTSKLTSFTTIWGRVAQGLCID